MAIRAVKAQKASQAELLQKEHGNIMQNLERQVIQQEVRSQVDFLSTCQATMCTSPIALKNALVTSYHILLGQIPPSPPFILFQRASQWRNSQLQLLLPHQCPNSLLSPNDDALPQIPWRACLWVEQLQRQPQEEPSASSSEKPYPGRKCLSQAMPRHLVGTQTW